MPFVALTGKANGHAGYLLAAGSGHGAAKGRHVMIIAKRRCNS
jgi:hypothetical protein